MWWVTLVIWPNYCFAYTITLRTFMPESRNQALCTQLFVVFLQGLREERAYSLRRPQNPSLEHLPPFMVFSRVAA